MKRLDDYILVIEAGNAMDAARRCAVSVYSKIKEGYEPLGGITVTYNGRGGDSMFTQAMVLYKEGEDR